jgi:membrane associated rhomboid family serine protease
MEQNGSREVALWAGASAFFGNLVGLKLLELLSDDSVIQVAAAVCVSGAVAGAVYSRERLQAARERRRGA